jgi:GAF domain-containing protein
MSSATARAELARAFENLPREQFQPSLVRVAIETRTTQRWCAATPDEVLRSDAADPAVRSLFAAVEARAVLFVPLIARGETIGVMSVVTSEPGRRYGASDVRLAEEVARRAALALDNVHLYQTARDAIATRDEVLGVVAHDLRNPLSAIELGARLIKHGLADGSADGLEHPVEAILRGANRANRTCSTSAGRRRKGSSSDATTSRRRRSCSTSSKHTGRCSRRETSRSSSPGCRRSPRSGPTAIACSRCSRTCSATR